MKANAQPLQEILFSNAQYLVPFFQRSYSWERENWERLGNDVQSLLRADATKKHFLGPLVCSLLSAVPGKTPQYQLIDGQQRLTTLSLLLLAVRDEAKAAGEHELANEIEVQYLVNQFKKGIDRYKLVPRTGDRELLAALIDGKSTADRDAHLVAAHEFFRKFVRTHAHNNEDYLRRLFDTVVSRLFLVAITLEEEDPYEIFESLNSTGLPLQESDLVRNFLFMRIPLSEQDEFQREHWAPFENEFDPAHGSVAISPTGFYRDFLMRHGQYSRAKETFSDFKKYFEAGGFAPATAVSELHRFVRFAKTIANQGEGMSPTTAEALRQFVWMEASTAHPVVLNLLDQRDAGEISEHEFIGCVRDLTSFILRRSICGESTRAYGRWFCELAGQLTGSVRERLQSYLLHRGWPDDEYFERSLVSFPIYRREFKKCRILLEALERADGHKEAVNLTSAIQIEHIMPQKLPAGAAGEQWREMLGLRHVKVHSQWLHTLGNLTLTGYNQSLGNRAFAEKKEQLASSKFSLNECFKAVDSWNDEEIAKRASKLAPHVSKNWPRPKSPIAYTPPARLASGANKGRERRIRYWSTFSDLLASSGVTLRPVRRPEGRICEFFLRMADVNLSARILPNRKQLSLQFRFARARGKEIFRCLELDRESIEEAFTMPPTWESSSKPTITFLRPGVAIQERYDWHDHHTWLVQTLSEIEVAILDRIRALHDAISEKSDSRQLMLEYWIGFHARMFERKSELLATTPLPQSWNDLAIGRSGVWTYAHIKPSSSSISVWFIMGTNFAASFFPQLEKDKSQIEEEFGQELEWVNPPNLKQWRIGLTRHGIDVENRDDWQSQHDWLIDQLTRMDDVFRDRVQQLTLEEEREDGGSGAYAEGLTVGDGGLIDP